MQIDTLFVHIPTQAPHLAGSTNSSMIGIKNGETGYRAIHTGASVETLNDGPVPAEVIDSALGASIFGWHAPIAKAAKAWFAERAEAAINAEG